MDELISPAVVRTLRLVYLASEEGVPVTASQIDAFADAAPPQLRSALSGRQSLLQIWEFQPKHQPSVSDYLTRVGFISPVAGYSSHVYELSRLGRAVVQAAGTSSEPTSEDLFEIVMRPDSALDYAHFVEEVAKLSGVLVIDRYAAVPNIIELAALIGVDQILTGGKTSADKSAADRRTKAQIGLAKVGEAAEVRILEQKAGRIHDRLVLPKEGRGLLLGGSLGGMAVNTVVSMSPEMTKALRALHEVHWEEAQPIRPAESSSEDATD
ncbi:hypothetical protein [Demequina sp.]|uniref:hypothetical protein n=1 Tax=Demequina sp. TaxID=2050685 RepID=UPI003D0F7D84